MRAILIALSLCLASGVCQAEKIYRWTEADGRVNYGDLPPRGASNVVKIDRRGAKADSVEAVQPGQASSPDELAMRDVECARKREQLANYQNAARLVEKDSLGREREYSEEETALLIGRTEVEINVLCGGL